MKTVPHSTHPSDELPTEIDGLPSDHPPESVTLKDGERFELRIGPVVKRIGDAAVRMLAYNGSIPGPTLFVRQGSKVVIHAVNDGDMEGTVHWHGLRLDNASDGTHLTQPPIPVGGSFTCQLEFPDPGVYWYHPHIREDHGQEMGLYGTIVVAPADSDYWPRADREISVTLDDVQIEDGKLAPFRRSTSTHTAMGRFGNVMLINGEPTLSLTARAGEVVRFYFTATSNARVFNVGVTGAPMKLSGRCEHEELVESVILAPSERAVVDVLFDEPGRHTLEHRTPQRTYVLSTIDVQGTRDSSRAGEFMRLRTNSDMAAERSRIAAYLGAEPDKTLALVATMDMADPHLASGVTLAYVCPMHADVVRDEPGRCPKCHMKLVPANLESSAAAPPAHTSDHASGDHHREDDARRDRGIEWEDEMVEGNRLTTPANTRWRLIDRATGAEGSAIDWRFRVGDQVKIRLVNEMESDHPMQHPFHIHGAGRFLVLARDGEVEPNLVWKDTVLVLTGQTVDILLDVTNPGVWMAHCHISEHHEAGMMINFRVDP